MALLCLVLGVVTVTNADPQHDDALIDQGSDVIAALPRATTSDKPAESSEDTSKSAFASEQLKMSNAVARLLDDPLTSPGERRTVALFHGRWDRLPQPTVQEQAVIALYRYDLNNPVLSDEQAPVMTRAEAALNRGDAAASLALLEGVDSQRADYLRGRALAFLGRIEDSVMSLRRAIAGAEKPPHTAQSLTIAASALGELGRVQGQPAKGYHRAMALLGRAHQEHDRLYWPAHLVEAELLVEKDNAKEAAEALLQALRLNPRCSRAWYLLGRQAAEGFNFSAAEECLGKLRMIHHHHLLADQLEADILLKQLDPKGANEVLSHSLKRYPLNRHLLARQAAAEALMLYRHPDRAETDAAEEQADVILVPKALAAYSAAFPTDPLGYYLTGKFLSLARQYPASNAFLRDAVSRAPGWPRPRIELGLMLMQWGKEEQAAKELEQAATLDPFNRRAINQSKLANELLRYQQIRTDHFIIKFQEGIDEVLALDMAAQIENIYEQVTGAFDHQPTNPTLIEIMPDGRRFAVRITGRTEIWTIAACTGDVVAMTPPRIGARQRGTFDWPRVVRHEFTHTVTLDKTRYRIPHWFTEACAVSQEGVGRDDGDCRLLANALLEDRLFGLDEINWAFIRPKSKQDRPLAYAQAHWMLQFITERFGRQSVLQMLAEYRAGARDSEALLSAIGLAPDTFFSQFKIWARGQVESWGYLPGQPNPRVEELITSNKGVNEITPDTRDQIADLLVEYPNHPPLLRLAAEISVRQDSYNKARAAVLQYARERPTDPWSKRVMLDLAIKARRWDDAVSPLEALDEQEQSSADLADQLAQIHRAAGRLEDAAVAIDRALHREPYNATLRETAATIELQRERPDRALRHLVANTILEPDRSIHQTRLAVLYARMNRPEDADRSARRALEMNPDAPVKAFLDPTSDE